MARCGSISQRSVTWTSVFTMSDISSAMPVFARRSSMGLR